MQGYKTSRKDICELIYKRMCYQGQSLFVILINVSWYIALFMMYVYSTLYFIWGEYQIQSVGVCVCVTVCVSVFPVIPVR